MRFNLDIQGIDQLNREMAELMQEVPAAVQRTGNFIIQSTQQRVKQKIRTGARSGRQYGSHRASAPGEPPANFSGKLADSYKAKLMTDDVRSSGNLGSNLGYARTLEYGGYVKTSAEFGGRLVYIEPRPVLLPSFYEALNSARGKLRREVAKIL